MLLSLILLASQLTAANCAVQLDIPSSAEGASIAHSNSFASFSVEPAFFWEFWGNTMDPNTLTFDLLDRIIEHGGRPNIRPGGETMDVMVYNSSGGSPVRTTNAAGDIYGVTVGPEYYLSWGIFPEGTKFVSTLNLENNSLEIAMGLAVASVQYAASDIFAFELGNEANNYSPNPWGNSTQAYVDQWLIWTASIDAAIDAVVPCNGTVLANPRWFASSATTDVTALQIKPVDIIPDGVNVHDQVEYYSIHSYPFSTCDAARAALATIENIVNHTMLVDYAVSEIGPSAEAAQAAGSRWVVGEFNSISCSGNPNVSDTFAQDLWTVDSELIYATMNASAVYLHQGATLVLQSGDQVNTAGANGSPGYSTYDFVYPRNSSLRGVARTLPSFVSQLFVAEAFATDGTRVRALETPAVGVDVDYFAAYAFYNRTGALSKIAVLNSVPYYANSTDDAAVSVDLGAYADVLWVKRLTAPRIDEEDGALATWAGQSFEEGVAVGDVDVEVVGDGIVRVRGSEAVLVFLNQDEAYAAGGA